MDKEGVIAMATVLLHSPVAEASQRRFRLRARRDPFFLLVEVVLFSTLMATLYLTASSRGTMMTYRISALQNQQASLERENARLQLQISQMQSLDRVQQVATTKLGMVPDDPNQVIYLQLRPQVSSVQRPTAPALPVAAQGASPAPAAAAR